MIASYIRDRIVHTLEDEIFTGLVVGYFGIAWLLEHAKIRIRARSIKSDLYRRAEEASTN